jgi:hypothetical protein
LEPAPYPSLADFAATWSDRDPSERAAFALDFGAALPVLPAAVRDRLEEVLDTVTSLQRADWLQGGVYVGPRAMPELYRDTLEVARRLEVALPSVIVSRVGMAGQGTFGTDSRAFLLLSSFYVKPATRVERRFLVGRQIGHIAAHQVTWITLYALIVDANGLRKLGRRALGPTLEVFLAPLSMGLRIALSRWHRVAELTADRAGLIACEDLHGARLALLRMALGTRPDMSPEDYLDHNRSQREDGPGKWAELLADRPWLYKRMQALELFADSQRYADIMGLTDSGDLMDDETLKRRTAALLQVG